MIYNLPKCKLQYHTMYIVEFIIILTPLTVFKDLFTNIYHIKFGKSHSHKDPYGPNENFLRIFGNIVR